MATAKTPRRRPAFARHVPLERLHRAEWNANVVPPETLAKVRRSIEEFGVVENLVARPHPERAGDLEVLSGNHRLELYREMGLPDAPVVEVEADDARARLLAQTLNRTRGADDPEAYARLLADVLAELPMEDVLGFLPETEQSIAQLLEGIAEPLPADIDEAPPVPAEPESTPGEVYELGPHRLACGDASDPDVLAILMEGERAGCLCSVFAVSRPRRSEDHPTMKPVELVRQMLVNSLPPTGAVLDPFAGSGSTLIAAHSLGRRARLVEIDPGYCDVIRARWEALERG
jgi:hypothetical protein